MQFMDAYSLCKILMNKEKPYILLVFSSLYFYLWPGSALSSVLQKRGFVLYFYFQELWSWAA